MGSKDVLAPGKNKTRQHSDSDGPGHVKPAGLAIPGWPIVLAFGCLMMLPMLGSFGLWDPQEISRADHAQDMADAGSFFDITVDGKHKPGPPLKVWLSAIGLKLMGVNELACRFPLALCGILALLIAYRVTSRLIDRTTGGAAVFVLGTTPTFLFQSRQLISEVPFYAALLASAGGLAAYLYPADGRRAKGDLLLAGFGLVAGFLAKGLAIGTVFPVACLGLALLGHAVCRSKAGKATEPPAGDGPPKPAKMGRDAVAAVVGTIVASAIVIAVLMAYLTDSAYMIMGDVTRSIAAPPPLDQPLKKLGYSFFPWTSLLPLMIGAFIASTTSRPCTGSGLLRTMVVVFAICGYVVAAIWSGFFPAMRYPSLPWIAVGVGVLATDLWRRDEPVHPLWGLTACAIALMIHQDFVMVPEGLVFNHLIASAKFPIEFSIKYPVRVFGVLFALFYYLALGGTPRPLNRYTQRHRRDSPASDQKKPTMPTLARFHASAQRIALLALDYVGQGFRVLGGEKQRYYLLAIGALTAAFGCICAFWITPTLSLHMSNKELFQAYQRCKDKAASPNQDQLAQYQVPGRGAAYYNSGQVKVIDRQPQLIDLLKRPERWFVLVPARQLAPLDQAARRADVAYHVLDDRSSKYLLITNKLRGICDKDINPLRRYVLSKAPKPSRVLEANFDNRVRLLGFDLDEEVKRGGKFPITLYFEVLRSIPSGYKVFIHFDQPAFRFHGDHDPLGGKYGTQYWLNGDFVVDTHHVAIPFITTPRGEYTVYMGFWRGSKRLEVKEGQHDGSNRLRLGTLRVR